MESEERKSLIYNVLRSYQKLSHNKLWKRVQQNFVSKGDSFAHDTFEKALAELVEEYKVKRDPEPNSKLGIIWYSPILDFKKIENDILTNFKTLVMHYCNELNSFSKRYKKLSSYDYAIELSRFVGLIFYAESMCHQYKLIFNNNKELKSLEKEITKLKTELDFYSSNKNKLFTQEVNQLLIKNYESSSQKILDEIHL